MNLTPLIISAPFGNWLESPYVTSTIGTYTVENRAGFMRWWLLWRLARTLRPRFGLGGWTNKLGLPNPGLAHLERLIVDMGPEWTCRKIVSIHGFNEREWDMLLSALTGARFLALELNISCPNVGHLSVPEDLFEKALKTGVSVIAKLPPVRYWRTFLRAYDSGVRVFHATNTLPVPSGGLSGRALKPIALDVIERMKEAKPDITVIGGGGIGAPQDLDDFHAAGADHYAVGSKLLTPKYWFHGIRDRFFIRLTSRADVLKARA